jgi:MFS family permease
MLFLVSLAGEIDAIKIYVAEKIGKKRRHLAIGIVSFSSQIGVLLASVMYHVAISFEEIQWLWKMNFFLGGLLGLFIIMMRGLLQESEAFLKSKSRAIEEADIGIVSIIGNNKMKFTLAVLINGMLGGGYHFLIIFLGTFAANVADVISPEQATSGNIKIIALYGIACVLSGYVSDRIHMTKQTVIALTCSISCVVMMEFMLNLGMFAVYLHYALAFIAPFYAVPCAIKMQSLFATGVRMRMFSLSHSLGSLIFSSTTPFMCMLIWRWSQSFPLVLGYFLIQLVVLFFALLAMARKDYINMFET